MKPVNIFRISRIRDEELFNIAAKHEADDHDNHRVRIHEINSLRILADALFAEGVTLEEFDGFYFGFIIPQIGKEFDLLKVTGGCCLNIELKSQDVTEEHIRSQLLRNSHYLNHLGRPLCLYTVVRSKNHSAPPNILSPRKAIRRNSSRNSIFSPPLRNMSKKNC